MLVVNYKTAYQNVKKIITIDRYDDPGELHKIKGNKELGFKITMFGGSGYALFEFAAEHGTKKNIDKYAGSLIHYTSGVVCKILFAESYICDFWYHLDAESR